MSRSAELYPASMSVDLEDYFHPELVRRSIGPQDRRERVSASTAPLLDLFERYGIRATFFVVGEVIRAAPALIRRIAGAGHEIGCHTYSHRPLWELDPESFRREIRDFGAALEEVAPGTLVRGFRAPTFSLDARTSWALDVLGEEGFQYDSSIVPSRGPLYGCPGAPRGIYRPSRENFLVHDAAGPLVEFPAPVSRLGGVTVPVGGGIYLRGLPLVIYKRLVRGLLRRRPFFLYVHPWETDPDVPRVALPRLSSLATYCGIRGMLRKIENLLQTFKFTTMGAVVDQYGGGT